MSKQNDTFRDAERAMLGDILTSPTLWPSMVALCDDFGGRFVGSADERNAAAYLVRFHQTDGNPWAAAEFANRIAAKAVTRRGLPAKTAVVRQLVTEQMHSSAGW